MSTEDKIAALHQEIGRRYVAALTRDRKFGSPIEELFFCSLASTVANIAENIDRLDACQDDQAIARLNWFLSIGTTPDAVAATICGWHIIPQFKFGPYRVDFAACSPGLPMVAVECDGHQFHERTKEQVARDKKRDRHFQSNGWRVLRFSGSEIYKDADACVGELLGLIESIATARVR